MSKRPIPSVANDFASVIALLTARHIIQNPSPGNMMEVAKKVHFATYSLVLWRFRLRKLKVNSSVFTDEIASDALQILPQILMGYGKTTTLLTRGIIENLLRHIYYTDHVVEFGWMNREKKYFKSMEELLDYAKRHPDFEVSEGAFDAINRLSTLYSELSGGVHGRTVRDLETRKSLAKIQYEEQAGAKHAAAVERCVASVNFLLAVFHRDQVHKFQTEDKRIILRAMPAAARNAWKALD